MSTQEPSTAGASAAGDHGKVAAWIEPDEFWPWFHIHKSEDSFADRIEVDEATLKRWSETLSAAYKVQEEIKEAVGWMK